MASVKDLLVNGSSRFIGKIYASDQFISQVANGTAPFVVSSSTLVTNLNSDLLDGYHASDFFRYEGLWNSGNGWNVDNALGMAFTYADHGAPNNWGTTVTFEYTRNSPYRFQMHSTGYNNALYYRNKSADRGGWTNWARILDSENSYVSSGYGYINGTQITALPDWTRVSRVSKNSDNAEIETVTGWQTGGFIQVQRFCPPGMYRTTEDQPAPYGIGFGNGSESGGIMPVGSGDYLQELRFYGANSGPTIFTFGRQIWEGSSYDNRNSNRYETYASINGTNGYIKTSGNLSLGTDSNYSRINIAYNNFAINFREGRGYDTGFFYGTYGNEFLALTTQQSVTSLIFGNGYDPYSLASGSFISGDGSNYTYGASTDVIQIKQNCVNIGDVWRHNVTPDYKLKVNGSIALSGVQSNHIYFPNDGNYTHYYTGGGDEHFSVGYGRIQGYANIYINADTDGSTSEYILLTAGRGVSSTTAHGLKVGYNTLTWLDNTIWHAGNDGSGSGLDADLLDGYNSSSFLRYEGYWDSTHGSTGVNDQYGMNFVYSGDGAPFSWGVMVTFEPSRASGYRLQIGSNGYSNSGLWYRNRSSDRGGWTDWVNVWDVTNYNSLIRDGLVDYSQNRSTSRNTDSTCLPNGFYWCNEGTLPSNVGDIDIITVNANTSYGHQLGFKFSGNGTTGNSYDGKDLYTRIYNNGSWLPWYSIYTSGNTGWNYNSAIRYEPHTRKFVVEGGSNGWNKHAYSTDGYSTDVEVSFKPGQTNTAIMVGLNTDPTTNESYDSIDYCWYTADDGNVYIYESGSYISSYGAYSTGDEFIINYSGGFIRYYWNGSLKRTVARTISSKFYFDSSFYYTTGNIYDVWFGKKSHETVGEDNQAINALLHSGYGRGDNDAGSTWIFIDDAGGYSSTWGIKHNQSSNLIEFYGAGSRYAYINLDGGNINSQRNYRLLDYGGNYHSTNTLSGLAGEIWFGGNFHIDSQNGYELYLNYYSEYNTYINPRGGNVGIGTTSPSAKLDVRGPDAVSMSMDTSNSYRFSPSFKGTIHLAHASHGSGSGVNNGYVDGITFGVGTSAYAGIFVQNSGSYGSRIIFTTTDDYTYNKARMILDSGGNLAIGTMSPAALLHVHGNILYDGSDATMKIYEVDGGQSCGPETVAIQTCFDRVTNPDSHSYVNDYRNRCFLSLQPRNGVVGITETTTNRTRYENSTYSLIVNGLSNIGKSTLDNTAFTSTLTLFANQNNESYNENFNESASSWGITFKRQWDTGSQNVTSAGIYAVGSGNWRTGLAFRVKNNTTAAGYHDITALWLSPAGSLLQQCYNSWLSPARVQIGRLDSSSYSDRACIGVTNGNLHIDCYSGYATYINYYCPGTIYLNGGSYYINSSGSYYNGTAEYSYNSDKLDGYDYNALPYIYWKEQWIDMTGYSESYWHPVVTSLPTGGYRRIKVTVQFNSGTAPSWSTHGSGFTCNLDLWTTAHGWGTTSSQTICLNSTYGFADQNPVGWYQLGNASHGILLLRGGGKYLVCTDWDSSWTIYNQSTTDYAGTQYEQSCGPYTSWPGIFNGSTTKNTIYAHVEGDLYGTANYANDAHRLYPMSAYPNNTHPGYGLKCWYSWGQYHDGTSGYCNGISLGSNVNDTAYGWQLCQDLWNDTLYMRRYNSGWQPWRSIFGLRSTTSSGITSLDCKEYQIYNCTVSSGGTMTLYDIPRDCGECHIIIYNSGSSTISITLPSSYRRNVSSISIASGAFGEVNVINAAGTIYIRAV